MRAAFTLLAIGMLLSGCLTAQERALQLSAADDDACRSYGAAPGSDAYVQCRTTKSQQHEMAAAAVRAAIIGAPPTSCTTFGTTTNCN